MSQGGAGSAPGSADVLAGLAGVIAQVTERAREDVALERTFVDDLHIDSLAMVEILEGSARHFGVPIADEDVKHFVRVRDLVDYIAVRRDAGPA